MSEKLQERIDAIDKELAIMQYNKATQGHFAVLRARKAQLQSEIVERALKSKHKGTGFAIKKVGDATAILVGYPSVGKSTLLNAITNQESKVAAYDFTTLDAIPGMMIEVPDRYKGARIQLIDLPGIIEGGATGKGRGKEVFASVRNADLVIILLDAPRVHLLPVVLEELYKANIRLDQHPPNVNIRKSQYGGLNVTGFRAHASKEEIVSVLREFRISCAEVFLNEANLTLDQIIDVAVGNRMYIPSLVVVNKIDLLSPAELAELPKKINHPFIAISSEKEIGLEELKEAIVQKIGLMRVVLRRPKGEADFDEPLIVRSGATVEDVCNKIHRRFKDDFRYANVWGTSVKFPGQKCGLSHRLQDSDIVKIIRYHG